MGRALAFLAVAAGWPAGGTAQDGTGVLPAPGFTLAAGRASSPPTIDGRLAPDEWDDSAVASGFVQYEPQRGAPSPFRTEGLVMHDAETVYIAFRVYDPAPPAAQLTRRDADLTTDDAVIVVLDTHFDRRSAYYFITNVLGTQADGRISNDGRTVDDTWDAAWTAAARRTEFGWTAELAIPLRSIRFRSGHDRTWGINLGRSRRRTLETSFWAGPLENAFRVSQAGALTGLDVPAPTRRHQAIVFGLNRIQENADDDLDVGGDLRVALTPELSFYGTVNPDFATIEADQEQVNLTRFELSLPEKRPFFLESSELFRQRIRTFYSRRIPDIVGGGQATGKIGAWTLASLVARAPRVEDIPAANYGVTRLQRDVGARSNVALTVGDRAIGSDRQGSASVDATLFFTNVLGMTAQAVRSWGPAAGGPWAYFIRPSYDTPTRHFHVRYTHLGDGFAQNANAIGFIRDDDRREVDSAFEQTFWVRGATVDRVRYDSNYNAYWSQRGTLRSWQIDQDVSLDLANRVSATVSHTEEFKRFEADFRNRETGLSVGYNTREFESVRAGVSVGKNFGSDFVLWTAGAGRKITEALSVEYDLQRFTLTPDPDGRDTWIHVIRVDQFFTPDLFLRVFFQANSGIDRRNVQAVFVYRYRPPFGSIQLAFQRGTAEFGESSDQGNTLFLKATTVF